MKNFMLVLGLMGIGALASARTVTVEAFTDDGFATARCPQGYTVDECDFDNNRSCDNTTESRTFCRADSRHNRDCHITAYCRRQPRRVSIQGWTDDGYKQVSCPAGFRRESCNFDYNSCDNLRQGYASCGADSRNHRGCTFSGVCVENL